MTPFPSFKQIQRWRSQHPNHLGEMRAGRVPFAVRIVPVEHMLAFEQIPDLTRSG